MDKNRLGQFIILGLTILAAVASWFWLKNVLSGEGNWILSVGGFFILLILLSLSWLLIKSRTIMLTGLAIILVCFFLVFGFKIEYLVVLLVAGLLFLFGSYRVLNEKEVRIKIQCYKILRRGLPSALTGLALIIATAYYFSPLASKTAVQIEIPRPWFNLMIKPMMGTIEEQLEKSLANQIGEKVPAGYEQMIPQLSKQFDLQLEGDENIEDVLYQLVNQQLNQFSQPYKEYFPLGLAVGFFFILKAISIPLIWLVILFSWLIFKILISLEVIKIEEKAVLKEEIKGFVQNHEAKPK